MSDLIDRQAAVDTLDKHLRTTDVPVSYPGIISALTEWLNKLPSAQPERKTGKWIPVTRIEEWHEEEGLVGFPPEVKEFPQCTIKWVDATEPDEVDGLRCSECDTVYDFTEARNWCSECGADMREPEDIPMEYFENGGR